MADVVELKISLADIPKRFSRDHNFDMCALDIIAYVRGSVEKDPWKHVVLDCNSNPASSEDLEHSGIFWKGYNDNKVSKFYGIGTKVYCVIDASELNPDLPDLGLEAITDHFREEYDVQSFEVLITGDDDKGGPITQLLKKVHDYVSTTGRLDIIFPTFIVRLNKLLPNGLDISPYAERLEKQFQRNGLDYKYLQDMLRELDGVIDAGNTIVQDLAEKRTEYVKTLTTYLILKHHLPALNTEAFILDYLEYHFFYCKEHMSLFERFDFIHKMPVAVGFIGANSGLISRAQVVNRRYPKPHYVFDIAKRCLVENVEDFDFKVGDPTVRFADYRQYFPGSSTHITESASSGLAKSGRTDEVADKNLVDLFTELSSLVKDEEVYLTVKNTILAVKDNRRYLLYCPEEGVLQLLLGNEYHPMFPLNVSEENFDQLIDIQMALSFTKKQIASNASDGNAAMLQRWQQFDPEKAMRPAFPLEVTLFSRILPPSRNGLSYYDKRLRCFKNVLPIVTSLDYSHENTSRLFNNISLKNLRRDPQARYAINSFGTVVTSNMEMPVVPVTFEAFRGGQGGGGSLL